MSKLAGSRRIRLDIDRIRNTVATASSSTTTRPTGEALPNSSSLAGRRRLLGEDRHLLPGALARRPAPRSTSTAFIVATALPPLTSGALTVRAVQAPRPTATCSSIPANRSSSGTGASTSERTSS